MPRPRHLVDVSQAESFKRSLAAQFDALLDGDGWLADGMVGVPGVRLTQAVDTNAVFAILPPGAAEELQRRWRFYTWDSSTGEVRWMCSWDTTPEDVDAFAADIRAVA